MIRVLIVIDDFEFGGAQRQVVELANNMRASEFDVHVGSLCEYNPLADRLRDRDARFHVVPKRHKFDISVVPRLARLLRTLRTDIVHGYLFTANIATRLAGRLAGTPVVIGSERNANYCLLKRQLLAYRLTKGCVDLIIANSKAGAEFNSRLLGYDMARYRIVHNGVDTERFVPRDGGTAKASLGIADSERVVGIFASFKRQKNHGLFFAAAKRVLARVPHTRLLVVGDELYQGLHGSADYKREMNLLVDRLGIRDRLLFLSNQKDVEQLYPVCDLTVLPSLHEGTPNVLLESMACGVPVVATDVCDNSYVAPSGKVGCLVPLGGEDRMAECICLLLENDQLRREMGKRARAWVEQEFSTLRLAQKTEAVYAEALGLKGSG